MGIRTVSVCYTQSRLSTRRGNLTLESGRTVPPVAMAMSLSWFFLLSPKPGAFTATTCSPTFSLEVTAWFHLSLFTFCLTSSKHIKTKAARTC